MAVDAIAEKLSTGASVRFFVVGYDTRLGLLAKEWTIEAQVERDPRVKSLRTRIDRLHTFDALVSKFLTRALERRFGSSHERYRTLRAGKMKNGLLWLMKDPWKLWWTHFVKAKYLHLVLA